MNTSYNLIRSCIACCESGRGCVEFALCVSPFDLAKQKLPNDHLNKTNHSRVERGFQLQKEQQNNNKGSFFWCENAVRLIRSKSTAIRFRSVSAQSQRLINSNSN